MKIFKVVSDLTEIPLLEVRSDGNRIEVIVDNTHGKMPSEIGNSLQSLEQYIQKSSHLRLEEPSEPTAHLLRYVLENGDIAEVTTDGATCLLNGKLLSRAEKAAFFDSLTSGKIKVARRADIQNPIPVPSSQQKIDDQKIYTKSEIELMDQYVKKTKKSIRQQNLDKLHGKMNLSNYSFDVPSYDIPFTQRLAQVIEEGKNDAE